MQAMDRQYLETPFYGSRRMKASLDRQGLPVSRKRVQRLMRLMGLRAIYRQPRTSQPAAGRWVYPYLLRDLTITRANQVWAADITTCPWPGDSCTWWPSWTGTAGTWWPGDCPHSGDRLLCRGAGRRPEPGNARRVQHRPGKPVHQPRVHADTPGSLGEDQHGWQRQVPGQHISWTLRISSGVSKGIDKPVVQSGRDFPYIRVGGGQ